MPEIPENITREHLLKAIERIDQEGVPGNAHSSTYDVVHEGKAYPPKLVVSWANVFVNGEELNRSSFEGGKGTDCFKLLEREGIVIEKKDDLTSLYNLWDEFLAAWPFERVQSMSLDEYTGVGNKDSFCYWIEIRLKELGSILGGSSFKFGIYRRSDQGERPANDRELYTNEYAWESKFGASPQEAFNVVKNHILTIISCVKSGTLEPIDEIPFWTVYKWKIAFLYQERSSPRVIAAYRVQNLVAYLHSANFTESTPHSIIYKTIMEDRGGRNVLEFSRYVWRISEQRLLKKTSDTSGYAAVYDYFPQIERFLEQAKTGDLKTKGYLREAYGLKVKVSFGQGVSAKIPWISFLGKDQKTSEGIYPVFLYFKELEQLILGYGTSEGNIPPINWPSLSEQTYKDYLLEHFNYESPRYGKSKVFRVYDVSQGIDGDELNKDLCDLVNIYRDVLLGSKTHEVKEPRSETSMKVDANMPLNTILYGPPGTGKTYHTIDRALQILAPVFLDANRDNRKALKERFDQLANESRIDFVTFHQSFSYEDFVEGLKATTEDGQINYEVDDGIFKRMCKEASPNIEKESSKMIDVSNRTIWKMSLGNTLGSDSYVYDKCIESDEIRLGYGDDVDFSGCNSRDQIANQFSEKGYELKPQDYGVTCLDIFKNQMNIGDVVIVSDGNLKLRAIGEVSGNYQYAPDPEFASYDHTRKVIWHRVYEKSLPYERVMQKKFSQMTLYKLSRKTVDVAKLQSLLEKTDKSLSSNAAMTHDKRVLIIDEINRGNISSIFGELITLIEPSKRAGAEEALAVTLPYSKETFQVPSNLHLIGTMNTADRSLALMDTALRRRFDFVEMMPDVSLLNGVGVKGIDVAKMLLKMNQRIEVLYDREHTLGHAFFMQLKDVEDDDQRFALLQNIFANKILPLLEEYFFEDWAKIRLVLGDNSKDASHQLITENGKDYDVSTLFGKSVDLGYELEEQKTYTRNDDALNHPESYFGIYVE